MGEAGVSRFVSARVLGHVDSSMTDTGIYDRHAYAPEKRRALEALARKVGEIIGGDAAMRGEWLAVPTAEPYNYLVC